MGEKEIAAKVVEHEEGQFGGHRSLKPASRLWTLRDFGNREELARLSARLDLDSQRPNSTQSSGAPPLRFGMMATTARLFKPPAEHSKLSFKPFLVQGCRARTSPFSFHSTTQRRDRRVFAFAISTPTPRRRHGNRLTRALPSWSAGHLWVSATWSLTPDGPSQRLARPSRCLAVLSYVAHLVDRCDVEKAK